MESEDIRAIVVFGSVGVVCGVISAVCFRRSRRPYLSTSIGAFVMAIGVALVGAFILEAAHAVIKQGYSFGEALSFGLRAAFILAFVVPFVTGAPAAIAGLLVQWLLQFNRRKECGGQPPSTHK